MANLTNLEEVALRIFGMFCQTTEMDMLGDEKAQRYMTKAFDMAKSFIAHPSNPKREIPPDA